METVPSGRQMTRACLRLTPSSSSMMSQSGDRPMRTSPWLSLNIRPTDLPESTMRYGFGRPGTSAVVSRSDRGRMLVLSSSSSSGNADPFW